MTQGNYAVVICFPLIVKANGVYASLWVKCENSIRSDVSSSWWVGRDKTVSEPAFVSFALPIGWHLLAEFYTFLSIIYAMEDIVQTFFMDFSYWP